MRLRDAQITKHVERHTTGLRGLQSHSDGVSHRDDKDEHNGDEGDEPSAVIVQGAPASSEQQRVELLVAQLKLLLIHIGIEPRDREPVEPDSAEAHGTGDEKEQERDIEREMEPVGRRFLQPDGKRSQADGIEPEQRGRLRIDDAEVCVQELQELLAWAEGVQ